jgi:hypothetical protein
VIESFKIVFTLKYLNKIKKKLNPGEFSINALKTKAKKFPHNLIKSWDVTDYHP